MPGGCQRPASSPGLGRSGRQGPLSLVQEQDGDRELGLQARTGRTTNQGLDPTHLRLFGALGGHRKMLSGY